MFIEWQKLLSTGGFIILLGYVPTWRNLEFLDLLMKFSFGIYTHGLSA